jgi:hypothetical protein
VPLNAVQRLQTFLNPLKLTHRPFEVLKLDFLGPVTPPSPMGNAYIFVITNFFTKWVVVVPLANTTALVTAKALVDKVILYHGPPRTVVRDRGFNFTSK